MQLSTVKISNLLSFPYIENLTNTEGVKFHNSEKGIINIMIWPNWSGKSNLLDIIHSLWKYGITTNYEITQQQGKPMIVEHNTTQHTLTKHRWTEDKHAHIYISLLLNQHDIDNLGFVNKYSTTLNTILEQYSDISFRFKTIDSSHLAEQHKIPLYFTINSTDHDIVLHRNKLTPVVEIIYDYLQQFELIQHCMSIYNSHHKQTQERSRYPLHNTFAIINAHDRTGMTNQQHQTIDDSITHQEQYPTSKPIRLFLKKYHSLTHMSDLSEQSLLPSFFLESLNTTLQQYVWLTLHIVKTGEITFSDRMWYMMWYDELSSGEQSFVSIILLIYSHDLHNGLLIIDEPELHLHPQSQELFIELLEDMKNRQNIQCIIATHAPSMINEHNINHVFRCSKKEHASTISCPENHIWEDDATLLQMLKFDNIAKIFFVDTIILVEGETDMYFVSFYLNYLKTQTEWQQRLVNYEIVTIGWKWWFKRWKRFLNKFGISSHYIGDRDNIVEYGIVNSIKKPKHHIHRSSFQRGSKYAALVWTMKQENNKEYTMILQWIQKLYKDHVYILSEGDLEAYLWLPAKGLDDTVHFCQHNFFAWLQDHHYDSKRKELNTIIDMIFH